MQFYILFLISWHVSPFRTRVAHERESIRRPCPTSLLELGLLRVNELISKADGKKTTPLAFLSF